jgi:hypothetical protein
MIHGEIRQYEYKFMAEINTIFRSYNLVPKCVTFEFISSSGFEDRNLSYDMKLQPVNLTLSVRIRQNYYLQYRDFTIRSKANGGKCEIDKLKEGYGQIYFYGWMNTQQTKIEDWCVVDINKIRPYLDQGDRRVNIDKTEFMCYDYQWIKEKKAMIAELDDYKLPF